MNKTVRNALIATLIALLVGAIGYYLFLPPLNLQAKSFWIFLTVVIAAFTVPFCIMNAVGRNEWAETSGSSKKTVERSI